MAGWDEVSAAAPEQPAAGGWDAVSTTTPDESSHPFVNHFVTAVAASVGEKVARNMVETGKTPSLFGYASQIPGMMYEGEKTAIKTGAQFESELAAPSFNPQQRTALENANLYIPPIGSRIKNDGSPLTAENYKEYTADILMNSAPARLVMSESALFAPLMPLFDIAQGTAKKLGASQGDVDLATAGLTIAGASELGGVKGAVAEGLEHHVMGSPESTFMGTTDPTPTMAEVAHRAADTKSTIPTPTTPEFDIHQTARQLAPETFSEYDALQTRKDAYTQTFNELLDQRRADAVANAPHNDEIADLQSKLEDANARKAKIYQEKIDELQTKNAEYVEEQMHPLNYQGDIKNVRGQLAAITKRIGDLAPDVKDAYQRADELRPSQTEEPKDQPPAHAASETNPSAEESAAPVKESSTPEQTQSSLNNIIKEVSGKLVEAGRPADEAEASAQLVAAHYKALSDMGWIKEAPEEAYRKYAPEIVQGKAKQVKRIVELSQNKEFQQGGARGSFILPFGDFKGGVIGLRPGADASTFIHELGHSWLEEMRRFAAEPDAPQSLKDTHQTVKDWLKAEGDSPLTRAQHEKFARGFERYMSEGTAPSKGLARVFQQFKDWLSKIYQSAKDLRVKLTPEIQDVFDHLLEANPEKTVIAPEVESTKESAKTELSEAAKPDEQAVNELKVSENTPPGEGITNPAFNVDPPRIAETQFVDKAGNIRLENLTNDEDIRSAIRDKAEMYDNPSTKSVTQRDMQDLALSAGIPEKEISLKKLESLVSEDGKPLAVHIQVVRQMFVDSAKAVQSLEEKVVSSQSDEDAANYFNAVQRQLAIGRTLSAATAEVGRGLGSGFINISKEDLKDAQNLTEFLQSATGRTLEDYKKMAVMSRKMNDAQRAKLIQDSVKPNFFDKLQSYRDIALLSGPITHGVYVNANVINAIMRIPERYAAARISEKMNAEERVHFGEASEMAWALANPDSLKNALESWRTYTQILPGVGSKKFTSLAKKVELPEKPDSFPTPLDAMKYGYNVAAAQVPRAIGALHSFSYTIMNNQEMAARTFRRAKDEGLEPGTDKFAARLQELRTNPPGDLIDDVAKNSLREVNMGKSGPFMGKLSLVVNSNRFLKWMFPFIKMEMAAKANSYVERTPLAYLSTETRANLSGANGEVAKAIQLGKIQANMAVAGSLFLLGSQFVNDDGPKDPNEKKVWMLTNTPNSFQAGPICVPLKALGRLGEFLKLGATLHRTAGEWWEGEDGHRVVADLSENLMHDMTDGTFTENLKNLLDVGWSPDQYGKQFLQNFATQFLPFSVGMGQIAHEVDPFQRDTKTDDAVGPLSLAKGIARAYESKVPFLSRELEPKYDVLGNPISRNVSYHEQYENDPVVQRMDALHIRIGRLDSKVFGVQLNSEQYATYAQRAGIYTKEILDRVITPQFANYPQAEQIREIHDIVTQCRDRARQDVMVQHPEVLSKAIDFSKTANGQKLQ